MNNRNLVRAAYFAALILIVVPIFDTIVALVPLRFGEVRWRYGTVGLLANSVVIPLAGLLLAFFVANALEHGKVLRTLGVLAWIGVVGAVVCVGAFTLDALQTKVEVNPTQNAAFLLATGTAIGKLLVAALLLGFLGAAGLKGARSAGSRNEPAPLIKGGMGRPGS